MFQPSIYKIFFKLVLLIEELTNFIGYVLKNICIFVS